MKIFYLCLSILISIVVNAQVFFGETNSPNLGAMLDLNGQNVSNINKGLALPRVPLRDSVHLYPMFDSIMNQYDSASKKQQQNQLHEGMLVYNTAKGGHFCPGLYVWTGSIWRDLTPTPPDTTMIDGEGNVYRAKWFGTWCEGNYWITSNLYSTKKGNGENFAESVKMNPAVRSGFNTMLNINTKDDLSKTLPGISFYEDSLDGSTKRELSKFEYAKRFGLLYNYYQSMEACPSGWHLPSFDEWVELSRWLGRKHGNSNNGARARANRNYFASFSEPEIVNKWGKPSTESSVSFSGFDLEPSGYTRTDTKVSASFGSYATFWQSNTAQVSISNMASSISVNNNILANGTPELSILSFSVRCVKDK